MAALGVGLVAGLTYVTGYVCVKIVYKKYSKKAYQRRSQNEIFTISTTNLDPIIESNRIQLTRNNFVSVERISPVNRSYNDDPPTYEEALKMEACRKISQNTQAPVLTT